MIHFINTNFHFLYIFCLESIYIYCGISPFLVLLLVYLHTFRSFITFLSLSIYLGYFFLASPIPSMASCSLPFYFYFLRLVLLTPPGFKVLFIYFSNSISLFLSYPLSIFYISFYMSFEIPSQIRLV